MSSMDMTMNSMPAQSSTRMDMKMTDEDILLQLNVTEDMLDRTKGSWLFRTKLGRTVCWYLYLA
jgi:hypothetical protein